MFERKVLGNVPILPFMCISLNMNVHPLLYDTHILAKHSRENLTLLCRLHPPTHFFSEHIASNLLKQKVKSNTIKKGASVHDIFHDKWVIFRLFQGSGPVVPSLNHIPLPLLEISLFPSLFSSLSHDIIVCLSHETTPSIWPLPGNLRAAQLAQTGGSEAANTPQQLSFSACAMEITQQPTECKKRSWKLHSAQWLRSWTSILPSTS